MYCSKCGTQNLEGAEFCTKCGAPLGTQPSSSSLGLEKLQNNVKGLLCYVLGWITGIFFLVTEKNDPFVRFHAIQSIIFSGILTLLSIISSSFLTIYLWRIWALIALLNSLVSLAALALWILLMYKAYNNEYFKLPIIGDIAEKHAKK
jgi:uncharacterized membrane protein